MCEDLLKPIVESSKALGYPPKLEVLYPVKTVSNKKGLVREGVPCCPMVMGTVEKLVFASNKKTLNNVRAYKNKAPYVGRWVVFWMLLGGISDILFPIYE